MSNSSILKLFPQPIFKYQVDDYKNINEKLLKYIYELRKRDNQGVKKSNINGWHSRSFDFKEKNNVPNKFYSHINNYIRDVFTKYGCLNNPARIRYQFLSQSHIEHLIPLCHCLSR